MCAAFKQQDLGEIERRTTKSLKDLLSQYKRNRIPISINFREAVHWIPYGSERASHFLHSYPAKLLLHIPHLFVSNNLLSKPNEIVADPFCGSGTVLLEAILAGRNAVGIDANPLACLVSRVKTTPLTVEPLVSALDKLEAHIGELPVAPAPPDVVNLERWYYPHVIDQLAKLGHAVSRISNSKTRDFFSVCFSACARKVSLADPRISVPVKIRSDTYSDEHPLHAKSKRLLNRLKRISVWKCFREIALGNLDRIQALSRFNTLTKAEVNLGDARSHVRANHRTGGEISLIITSPPYAGAQKYVRASSLSLGWLGLCASDGLRSLEARSIGREHYPRSAYEELVKTDLPSADELLSKIHKRYPLRAHIAANYLLEMRCAFQSMTRELRPGGHLVIVAGNNYVCGLPFETRAYLRDLLLNAGLKLQLELIDTIKSRGLMTKRNSSANIITRESVMLFEKSLLPGL